MFVKSCAQKAMIGLQLFVMTFSNSINKFFLEVVANFNSPWDKKAMIGDFFTTFFSMIFFLKKKTQRWAQSLLAHGLKICDWSNFFKKLLNSNFNFLKKKVGQKNC